MANDPGTPQGAHEADENMLREFQYLNDKDFGYGKLRKTQLDTLNAINRVLKNNNVYLRGGSDYFVGGVNYVQLQNNLTFPKFQEAVNYITTEIQDTREDVRKKITDLIGTFIGKLRGQDEPKNTETSTTPSSPEAVSQETKKHDDHQHDETTASKYWKERGKKTAEWWEETKKSTVSVAKHPVAEITYQLSKPVRAIWNNENINVFNSNFFLWRWLRLK